MEVFSEYCSFKPYVQFVGYLNMLYNQDFFSYFPYSIVKMGHSFPTSRK